MSMQRRLLLLLLACAALLWAVTLTASFLHARHEINELFDTQLIRIARQVRFTLPASVSITLPAPVVDFDAKGPQGEAELADLSIAVWNAGGDLTLADREGVLLPKPASGDGFVDLELNREPWRVYYQGSQSREWLVAVGQRMGERNELMLDLVLSQLSLWILALPILLGAMLASVRHALRPLEVLATELEQRSPEDLRGFPEQAPRELRPLVKAMNRLFRRVDAAIERERRLTVDAAHELRTPIAALQAQMEVAQLAKAEGVRQNALARLTDGIDRLASLVMQLLALARVENLPALRRPKQVSWERVMEQVLTDCLPLADAKSAEIACQWPAESAASLRLQGDEDLLATMLRNLVDNAVRYAPPHAHITVTFHVDEVRVEDDGPGVAPHELERLGDRFHRPPGQAEPGSGLGLSIVKRIAQLHGLDVNFANRPEGGFRATVARASAQHAPRAAHAMEKLSA